MSNSFNNNSTDSTLGAFAGGVEVGSSTGRVIMVNNTFIGNSAVASDTAVGGGGRIQAGGDITLINNVFVGNLVDTGSEASCAGGFRVFSTSGDLVITNNTFTLNSCIDGTIGGGLLASVFSDDSVVNIYNNIIFGNKAQGFGDDIAVSDDNNFNGIGSAVNLFNNDFSDFVNQCQDDFGCLSRISRGSNINQSPLFVDAANGDIHIRLGSPAIDSGDPNAPSIRSTDFETDPRSPLPDIGADEFVSCSGFGATIHGTPGNDVINGTNDRDVIRGLSGDDTINGLDGKDIICGGSGNDTIDGGRADDTIFGEEGNDRMNGSSGNDILRGEMGRDTISGGTGNDQMFGGSGNDTLRGNNGDDDMDGVDGVDTCDGGNQINGDTAVRCETVIDVP